MHEMDRIRGLILYILFILFGSCPLGGTKGTKQELQDRQDRTPIERILSVPSRSSDAVAREARTGIVCRWARGGAVRGAAEALNPAYS
jgi:hypothetical protein